jgi:hypothetical protein
MSDALVLRDIHQPPAPPWWPPAPGWWLLALLLLAIVAVPAWRAWQRARRRRAHAALFDRALRDAATPTAQLAAMSDLLRRASRRRHAAADTLLGDAWLRLLDDGLKTPTFATGAGRLLADGAYRRDVDAAAVDSLRPIARARFLEWMQP